MKRIIKTEDYRDGMPIATSNDLSLNECMVLTKAFFYDFDTNENLTELTINYYINHISFETVQEYIDFYAQNDYLIVIT